METNLHDINLQNNSLKSLPKELMAIVKNLVGFKADGNPWRCDCDLNWLLEWVQANNRSEGFICQEPEILNMYELHLDDLSCVNNASMVNDFYFASKYIVPVVITCVCVVCVAITGIYVSVRKARRRKRPHRKLMIENGHYYPQRLIPDTTERQVSSRTRNEKLSTKTSLGVGFTDTCLYGRLRLGKLLGRGAFGEVYEAYASEKGDIWKKVAVKKIRDGTSPEEAEQLLMEYQRLADTCKHPNIIQAYGSGCIQGSRILVLELAEDGDLLGYVKRLEMKNHREIQNLDSAEQGSYLVSRHPRLFLFMWNVAKGMEYLTRIKIVHRDLAARNVLIFSGPVAKISDFGLSRDIYESGYYYQESNGRLPYKWMSPETLSDGRYTTHSDVWSFGIMLWEIVTLGSNPYPGIPPDMLISMYSTGYRMPSPPLCPPDIYALMQECWQLDPKSRPPFGNIVEYLDSVIQTHTENPYFSVVKDT